MDKELFAVIADALVRELEEYYGDIGLRRVARITLEVASSVEQYLDEEQFIDDDEDEVVVDVASDEYWKGYDNGFDLASQTPYEIFLTGDRLASEDKSAQWREGFLEGLRHG